MFPTFAWGLPRAPKLIRVPEFSYQVILPEKAPDLSRKIAASGVKPIESQAAPPERRAAAAPKTPQANLVALLKEAPRRAPEPKMSLARPKQVENLPSRKVVSEGGSREAALGYFMLVRERIRREANRLYGSNRAEGEVRATFSIAKDGELKNLDLVPLAGGAAESLVDLTRRSLVLANPYPAFPQELSEGELRFRVRISFRAGGLEIQD